jgi:hypothetical protein
MDGAEGLDGADGIEGAEGMDGAGTGGLKFFGARLSGDDGAEFGADGGGPPPLGASLLGPPPDTNPLHAAEPGNLPHKSARARLERVAPVDNKVANIVIKNVFIL